MARATRKKRTSAEEVKYPYPTDWIEAVPGADPPADCLLLLWQEDQEAGILLSIGLWSSRLQAYIDEEGVLVELDSPVLRFHVIFSHQQRLLHL